MISTRAVLLALLLTVFISSSSCWSFKRDPIPRRTMMQEVFTKSSTMALMFPSTASSKYTVMAPLFDLPNSRGVGTTSLTSLLQSNDNKKWTVIFVYPGSPAGGCTLEARFLMRSMESFWQVHAQVVGIAVDAMDVTSGQTPCSVERIDLYPLSDSGGMVQAKLNAAVGGPRMGAKQIYILDPKGRIVWNKQNVQTRVPTSSEEVLARLKELQAQHR